MYQQSNNKIILKVALILCTNLFSLLRIFSIILSYKSRVIIKRKFFGLIMKCWSWMLMMCLMRMLKGQCTNNSSPAICSSHSSTSTTTVNGTAYCQCLSCPIGKSLDSLFISCCSSNMNCVTCLGLTTGGCTSCITGYAIVGTGCQLCSSVMPNCVQCSSSSLCTSCVNNSYAVNGNSCTLCSTLMPNCRLCSASNVCTSCLNNSYAVNGNSCPLCSTLMLNCRLCSASNACTSCVNNSYAVNGNSCPLCSTLMLNCRLCSASNVCSSCLNNSYALNGGACPLCNVVMPNCLTCSSNTACTACVSNIYALNGSNCPLCSVFLPNCVTCTSKTFCISCVSSNYILNAGSCPLCSTFISNCQTCSATNACTSCVSTNYALNITSCPLCSAFLSNCVTCTSKTSCSSCISNSYTLNNSLCTLCSSFLSNCVACSSNITCLNCLNNSWVINMSRCTACGLLLPFCLTCSSTAVCITCDPAGYLLPNSTCLLCTFPINFCFKCTYHTSNSSVTCDECDSQHTIDPISGYCYSCQSVMTACLVCYSNSTHCKACVQNTFSINVNSIPQHCQPCNATLNYCNRCLNQSLCIQCIVDPTIFLNRLANFTSSFVSGGYYHSINYTGTSGDCRFCNISYSHCVTCNSSQCLTCVTSPIITFVNGVYCDLCKNVLFACDLCISEFLCSKCKSSFFTLVTVSPTSRICKLCCDMMAGCLLCTSLTVCISCSVGYQVQGGCSASAGCLQVIQTGQRSSFCISCEPTEFHPTPINGTCFCKQGHTAGKYCTLIVGCQVISRQILADKCTSCDTNRHFYLHNGQCNCLDHYHLVGEQCIEICGDGLVIEDECDDGNQFDLDGCSSNCKVEKKYDCNGGSPTSSSFCKLQERIHISISEIRKEPNSNSLTVFLKVSHPTRHLMSINFPSALHYSPTNLLELTNIEPTAEYIKLSFKYFQDIPEILAKVVIDLNTSYFYQNELHTQYLLQATSGEILYFDKWAGSHYLNIDSPLFYLGIGALIVSVAGTISYKMIGVETLHTFQLVFMGMIFSKRYSNYFHHFEQLIIPFGQSGTIQANSKLQVPHRLAFMKYSMSFQHNLMIIGAIFSFLFFIYIAANFFWSFKKKTIKSQRQLTEKKECVNKFNSILKQYILLPLALGFFYHIIYSIIFQSYRFIASNEIQYSQLITFLKMFLVSSFSWIILDEVKRGFITFLKHKPNMKYRGVLHFAQPPLPHEPVRLYTPFFTVATISLGAYTAASALFNIKYYIEVNLLVSLIRIIVVAVHNPYQFRFHNIALLFNASVVFLAYLWLTFEQFYLFNPTITKITSIFMFSCLAAVQLLAVLRIAYNIWSKYRDPSSKDEASIKTSKAAEKPVQSKTEMENLLNKQTNKFGRKIDAETVGWRKKEMLKPEEDEQKKRKLEDLIKKSKQTFAFNLKINRSKANLVAQSKN